MEKHLLAGVDIGGTTVKLALTDLEGNILEKWEIHTDVSNAGRNIVKDIADSVSAKLKEAGFDFSRLLGLGIGAPGFINTEIGLIYEAVNLGWKNYYLKDEMEKLLSVPVFTDNDANLAAAGEMWKGAGNGAENLLCITLGTGVGGGIIAGGEIIHGMSGMAGEIGHITTVIEDGRPCNCGKHGCLETVASATGIAREGMKAAERDPAGKLGTLYKETGRLIAKDVFDCAKEGDNAALEVVNHAAAHLGLALANLANALNPEMIVVGGGVSKAGDYLINKIEQVFKRHAIPKIAMETRIREAQLGNDAGVIGAAWLAKQNL